MAPTLIPGPELTADGLTARELSPAATGGPTAAAVIPHDQQRALEVVVNEQLSERQRNMIAALLTVLSVSDLESVSPALAVAFTECVSALAD